MKSNTTACYIAAITLTFQTVDTLVSNGQKYGWFWTLVYAIISISLISMILNLDCKYKRPNKKSQHKSKHTYVKNLSFASLLKI